MTGSRSGSATSPSPATVADEVAREIEGEQAHVDRVYAELAKAGVRAGLVEADGLARGRTDRVGEARDEELTGLFERDALVLHAVRRRHALESQYEGLVFGRLDIDHPAPATATATARTARDGDGPAPEREVRYIGRLGVRDDEYEPLVIDWRAPAASPFYRATPVEPLGVLRRRVLRCKGADVVGVEDDLMVAEAPDDLVIVGDGALMAALTRSRGSQMRDIVATIQRHQDEAIRASARGITEITGGPGTGKTVVALHRAAYLLYSDRRRYESGGILVVGPSAAYTSYIERVLPSLGEETVTLRSLGDVVDVVSTERLDPPAAAAIKGSLRIRTVLSRAAHDAVPDAPEEFRAFVAGQAVRLDRRTLDQVRSRVLRQHQRNTGRSAAAPAARRRGIPAERPHRPGGVPRPVRGPPRGRRVHGRLVAAGRPARGRALARRRGAPAPVCPGRARRRGDAGAPRGHAHHPEHRHLVGRRRRAGRRRGRPRRGRAGGAQGGARLLRDRGARRRRRPRRGRGRSRPPAPTRSSRPTC